MSVFTELIQKSSALKSAENEVKALRRECLEEMKKKGETKMVLPAMGSISVRTKRPSKKKIDDPEILEIRRQIGEATDNLESDFKKNLYDLQRQIFLLHRQIYSLLRSTEVMKLEALLFEKTHEFLQKESTEYLVVKANG